MSSRAASLVAQSVRLIVPAGKATPSPPVGPALGARGVKAMDFAKQFNAHTAHLEPGTPTPVVITIQPDRSFTFTTKSPPITYLIKQAAGIEKGAATPEPGSTISEGKQVGTISVKHVYEMAKIKSRDDNLKGIDLEAISKSIIGTCKSMGVRVVR